MSDDIKLPELPAMMLTITGPDPDQGHWYSAEQMKAYARAAVELNRAWLPMDSAPKDGTAILVLLPDSDIPIAARYYERVGWKTTWDDYHLIGLNYPTSWMRIP